MSPPYPTKIWEADRIDGPVYLSKWDISDNFHRYNLRPVDVGIFSYIVPPLPGDPHLLLCIDLVLPMGWVNSPDLFCSTSEIVAGLANAYIKDANAYDPTYPPTASLYTTSPSPTSSNKRLQYVNVYMDDLNCATQGDSDQQRRVTELTIRSLKEVYPSIPQETRDSVSLKKELTGDGDWELEKEILGWIINTADGTLRLSNKRLNDLHYLLDTPPTLRRIPRKRLDRLIGKLKSIHLVILSTIGHFYYIQQALTQASQRRSYLSNNFHSDVSHWKQLCQSMKTRPTYLAEIVQRLATDPAIC